VIWPAFKMTLRLRLLSTALASLGLAAVLLIVGALFPAVGHSFGKLNIPKGVADLLGGADYGTITGWYRSEIGSIYGPLVISAMAITGVVSATAGEEEDRILALILAHPVKRSRLIAAKAAAIAVVIWLIAVATWIGLIAGVALAGGGISLGDLSAYSVHLAFFGLAIGAIALAAAAGTGRRAIATGVAAAVGVVGWLINGFAPLVDAIAWLKYLSPFYYYAGHDPLTEGVDIADLAVLCLLALGFTTVAMLRISRRDLRA
jgi:ABC-2 type transport system permease protein